MWRWFHKRHRGSALHPYTCTILSYPGRIRQTVRRGTRRGKGGRPSRGHGACGTGRRGLAPGGAAAAGCELARHHLFFCGEHKESHQPDQNVFYNGVVVHDDRHHANVRQVPFRAADDMLFVDIALARCEGTRGGAVGRGELRLGRRARLTCIQASVVHLVVVALGQYVHRAALFLVHLTRCGGCGCGRAQVQALRPVARTGCLGLRPVHTPPCMSRTLMMRCTIGISRSATLKTTMSPARKGVKPICKNRMSPR